MSGWIIAIALAAVIFAALLYVGKLPRESWTAIAAALVLGLAGYAMQGRPDLPAAPAAISTAQNENVKNLIEMRALMNANLSRARPYLILSDAYARDGDFQLGAAYINSGIRKNPKNAELWSGLAVQLLLAGEGQMSPPARYAFDKARSLSPKHPVPDYFDGLTALYDGRIDETIQLWQGILDRADDDAPYRKRLSAQLAALKKLRDAAAKGQAVQPQ